MGFLARSAVVVGLWAGVAFGASLPVTLIWQAPEPCPQYDEVWRRLSERLGRAPLAPQGATFAARAVAQPLPDGTWTLALETLTESGTGQRTLTGPTCEELTKRAVVVLALAIDPSLAPPPQVEPRAFWLALGPSTLLGALPSPTLGLMVDGRFEEGPFSVELGVGTSFLPPQPLPFESAALTATVVVTGGASGCVGQEWGRFRLGGCVQVGASVLQAFAAGVEGPLKTAATFELGPRLDARLHLNPRWALRLLGGVAVSMVRPTFVLTGAAGWSPALVTGHAAVVVEFKAW